MEWHELDRPYRDRLAVLRSRQPHEVLGIKEDSTAAEVRAAYLLLIKAYHPDRADSFMLRHNEEMVKLINEAYAQLRIRLKK